MARMICIYVAAANGFNRFELDFVHKSIWCFVHMYSIVYTLSHSQYTIRDVKFNFKNTRDVMLFVGHVLAQEKSSNASGKIVKYLPAKNSLLTRFTNFIYYFADALTLIAWIESANTCIYLVSIRPKI